MLEMIHTVHKQLNSPNKSCNESTIFKKMAHPLNNVKNKYFGKLKKRNS